MKLLAAALTIAAICVLDTMTATAQDYPFCLEGGDFGAGDCSYSTLQQCQASASGPDAWCQANPYVRTPNETQRPAQTRSTKRRP